MIRSSGAAGGRTGYCWYRPIMSVTNGKEARANQWAFSTWVLCLGTMQAKHEERSRCEAYYAQRFRGKG